jgi:hypothetical protein
MLYLLLISILLWYVLPHIYLYAIPIPMNLRIKAHLCWLRVTATELFKLPVGLLAPVVVPIALLFTKFEDNNLPALFKWWENDISINGDEIDREGNNAWALDYNKNAYYAKAVPRSFWARYVWLGWRNRASRLGESLGYQYKGTEFADRVTLGNKLVSRDIPGWKFVYSGPICQLMIVIPLGTSMCIRVNWGYKFFDKPRTMSVGITFSILSRKG